jgi:hypothetical protein
MPPNFCPIATLDFMNRLTCFSGFFWQSLIYTPFCFSLFVLLSCSTNKKVSSTTPSPLYPEEIASALLTDEALAQELEIQDQSFTRDTDRVVLAQGFLMNKTEQPLTVEVRTLFKSTQGETLESSPWKRLVLPPKVRVSQASPSINPMVSRYLLEIRRAP